MAFAHLYAAASWAAYVFISNLIPLYVLLMIAIRRYHRWAGTLAEACEGVLWGSGGAVC